MRIGVSIGRRDEVTISPTTEKVMVIGIVVIASILSMGYGQQRCHYHQQQSSSDIHAFLFSTLSVFKS